MSKLEEARCRTKARPTRILYLAKCAFHVRLRPRITWLSEDRFRWTVLYQLTQIQEDRLKHLLASLESSLFRFRLSCLDLCLSYGRFFDSLFDRYDEGGSHDRNRKSNRHRGNQTTRETEWREGKMTMIHKYNVAVIIPARGQRESRRNYIHRTRVVPPITAGELAS